MLKVPLASRIGFVSTFSRRVCVKLAHFTRRTVCPVGALLCDVRLEVGSLLARESRTSTRTKNLIDVAALSRAVLCLPVCLQ